LRLDALQLRLSKVNKKENNMFKSMFPRLFGQFKEGGIFRGHFTFTDSDDSWAPVTAETYNGFTVADGGTGVVVVSFPKCKQLEVLHASVRETVGTAANIRLVELPPITDAVAKAGTFTLNLYTNGTEAVAPALADPVDGAVLSLVLYVGTV
jgi:hypothetical protein